MIWLPSTSSVGKMDVKVPLTKALTSIAGNAWYYDEERTPKYTRNLRQEFDEEKFKNSMRVNTSIRIRGRQNSFSNERAIVDCRLLAREHARCTEA